MKIRLTVTALAVAAAFPAFSQSAVTTDEATLATTFVTATRQAQRVDEVLASVDVITREEIERAGNRTLVELLAGRPGVQVTSNGGAGASSSVFIRGASSRQTLLLIDGVRSGSATGGAPTFETIPLSLIERIEILRGPASSLYGADAFGGVIQIITRRDTSGFRPRAYVGVGSWDSYTASGGLSGQLDQLSYSFDAGHDRSRGFDVQPDARGGNTADRDGWRNSYFSGSLSLRFREHDEVRISHLQTDGRNWFDSTWPDETYDHYMDKRTQNSVARMRNQFSDGWFSTIQFGLSKDISRNKSSNDPASRFDTEQRQFMWQQDINLAVGDLLIAYERLEQKVDTTDNYERTKRVVNSWLLGWGAQLDRHALQVNFRHDRNSQFGAKNTGTLSYGYQLTDALDLRASLGTAFRAPTFNDLYYPGPFGSGNPNLRPEQARSMELGADWTGSFVTMGVTLYRNKVTDLIDWRETPPGSWNYVPFNVASARLSGMEVTSSVVLGDYNLRANYDFLRAKDLSTGRQLVRRAKHSASFAVDRSLGLWNIGAELDVQSRRGDSSGYMGGYGVTNIFANYSFAPDWRLEMRVNNLFDKHYELAKGYATPGVNAFIGVRYAPR